MEIRECSHCHIVKPLSEFAKNYRSGNYESHKRQCKVCRGIVTKRWKKRAKAEERDWYQNNKAKCRIKNQTYYEQNRAMIRVQQQDYNRRTRAARREYMLEYDYGLTAETFSEMVGQQLNACKICKRQMTMRALQGNSCCVDHCHITDKVRGLLCSTCNKGLGLFYDRPDLLDKAAAYARSWN